MALVAVVVTVASLRLGVRPWICLALGVGAAMVAEAAVEMLEYWLLNSDLSAVSAAETYVDTIADLASTLVGAITGGVLAALCWTRYKRHDQNPAHRQRNQPGEAPAPLAPVDPNPDLSSVRPT